MCNVGMKTNPGGQLAPDEILGRDKLINNPAEFANQVYRDALLKMGAMRY